MSKRREWREQPTAQPAWPIGWTKVHAIRDAAVAAAHNADCCGAIDRAEAAGARDEHVPDATVLPPYDEWMATWNYFRMTGARYE